MSKMREMKDSGIEWIGRIPSHWKITKCKYISKFINGFAFDSKDFVSEYQYPIIRIGDITNGSIDFKNCLGVNDNEGLDNYRIQENDILLAMSGATVGKVGLSTNKCSAYINQRVGIIRSNVFKYLFYNLQTSKFIEYILLQASGSAQPNVSGTVYGEFTIPFPPFPEQEAISDFLDKQCTEIDSVIEQTKATIEEYKKLKQSVITEAVTKGIRGDRPMKDSGIEWIGDIPAHWNIIALKFQCSMQSGKNLSAEQIADEGQYPVYGGNGIRGYYSEYNTSGDLLLVGRQGALCGNVHRVSGEFWATEHAVVTKCSDYAYRDFLYYLLIGMNLNQYASNTAAQPGLAVGEIVNVRTCFIPLDEQKEIANYLDKKCAEIDTLIAKKTALLEEMEAYKKSVIYEYVTGKKEIL